MDKKRCSKCGTEKPLTEFYKSKKSKDGYYSYCKDCDREYQKQYRPRRKDKYLLAKSRVCVCCKEEKPLSAYRLLQSKCILCQKSYDIARHNQMSPEQKAILAQQKRQWIKENPEKTTAHRKIRQAIKSGEITQEPCEVCGKTDVHAHHDDYSKPLSVRWLCPIHHGEVHYKPILT